MVTGVKFRLEDLDNRGAHLVPVERLGEDLEEDQVPVPVDDQAR